MTLRSNNFLISLLVAFWLQFLVFEVRAETSLTQSHSEADTEFELAFKNLVREHQIPGLSMAIVKDGDLLHSLNFGFADSNREVPISADTPFWIASVTKPFVALAFLHLEEEKKLDFDELAADTPNFDKLCKWLAGTTIPFARDLDCSAPITIRHILHHQVNGQPGSEFLYNPIMYSRLSRYLEHKFGVGVDGVEGRHNFLGQTIDRTILQPAEMTRSMSSMWDRSKMDVYFDLADGFQIDEHGKKRKLARPDKHIAGGAGVISTTNDLVKFENALNTRTIISDSMYERLLQPAPLNNGDLSAYGFGWYFQCLDGLKLMWHSGWDEEHGYSSIYLRVPEHNIAFIALANSEGLWWNNPLDKAMIEKSDFVQLFLERYLGGAGENKNLDRNCL